MSFRQLLTTAWISLAYLHSTSAHGSSTPNIHAVIVSSSRYWFNYRHVINALSIYQLLKGNGIPDANIILMLADDLPSNSRNSFKNLMYAAESNHQESHLPSLTSIYDALTEVDYRGSDVTVQNFVHAVMGVQPQSQRSISPSSRSLHTDENSTVLVYITGHGGDQFFKFQDEEEVTARDFSNMFSRMHQEGKYSRLLFIADTCQAFTLADEITAPNVISIGSSLKDENAYSHHSNSAVGVSIIERYTYNIIQRYRNHYMNIRHAYRSRTPMTLHQLLVEPFLPVKHRNGRETLPLGAHVGVREKFSDKSMRELYVDDFFGSPGKESNKMKQASLWRSRAALSSLANFEQDWGALWQSDDDKKASTLLNKESTLGSKKFEPKGSDTMFIDDEEPNILSFFALLLVVFFLLGVMSKFC